MPVGCLSVRSPPSDAGHLEGTRWGCEKADDRLSRSTAEIEGMYGATQSPNADEANVAPLASRNSAKAGARGAAIVVSVLLLVLCVVCVVVKEPGTTPFWQGILEHSEEAGTFTRQTGNSPAATKQASHAQTLSHLVRSIHKNLKEDIQVEEKWRAKLKPSTGAHDAARRATPLQRGHGAGGASTGKAHGFAANQKTKAERRINMVPVQPQTMNIVPSSIDPAVVKRPGALHGKKSAYFLDW